MSTTPQQDPLVTFSHRITQIKFIVLELAMLFVFLTWIWGKVRHDVFPEPPPAQTAPTQQSPLRSSACPHRRMVYPEEIGVHLTEGFMMDPEASVSALVFHHPDCVYFTASEGRE